MIDRVVHGLAAGTDLTVGEILDVLWLAASHPAGQAARGIDEPNDVPVREEPQPSAGAAAESILTPDPKLPLRLDAETSEDGKQTPATEVGFGTPRLIRDALTLPMALRRLRQVRAPGPRLAVDIEATVDSTAEARRLMVVLSRPQHRALDLALVVDDALSMRIWDDTFDDLERLLGQTGAFRAVSRWRLDVRSGFIRPDTPSANSGQSARARGSQPPQRLIDPSGRRLILVATDGRDPAWYIPQRRGAVPAWDAMAAWCVAMPTVLIQVLPAHYWATTAIGDPYLTMRARRPAAPNGQYEHRLAWWAADPGGPPLPVVTLAPEAIDAWARAVVNGTAWTSGITATPPDPEYAPAFNAKAEPGTLVNDFLSRASLGAQQLARVLASATTLSMPLIAVLRERLAPKTGVLELAEILASGLLEEIWPASGTGQPLLKYRQGTREILQRGTTAFEEWDAYAAVSRYLEDRQRIGGPLRALVPDADGTAMLDASDEPFAALHQTLATRLGLRTFSTDAQTSPQVEEPLADEVTSRAEEEPQQETDSSGLGPLLNEEELSDFIDHGIGQLDGDSEFMVVEIGAAGPLLWRVSRDYTGTPRVRHESIDPPATGESWGTYVAQLMTPSVSGPLIVRSSPDKSLSPAFDLQRAASRTMIAESGTSVDGLLHEAISLLIHPYGLVVVREEAAGVLRLDVQQLFPPGASRGDSITLRVRCAPADNQNTSFVVIRGDNLTDDVSSLHLTAVMTVTLAPGDYDVTAVLVRSGFVRFEGLPVEPREDPRRWPEIVATIPDRIISPQSVHLVCVVEVSGGTDRLLTRIKTLERLISMADGPGRHVTASLVTYGGHTPYRGAQEEPATVRVWAASAEQALAALRGLVSHKSLERDYPRAAALECALKMVAEQLPERDGNPTILLTVGGRPPHPPHVDALKEIIPCPHSVDWRAGLVRLKRISKIALGALCDPGADPEIWNHLGETAIANVNTVDLESFSAKLGLQERIIAGPFPLMRPDMLPTYADALPVTVEKQSIKNAERTARTETSLQKDSLLATQVTRAVEGDQDAWRELVDRYTPLVYTICTRYRMSDHDIEDVAQHVWLLLLEQLGRLREPAALPGWLATTTARECLRVVTAANKSGQLDKMLADPALFADDTVIDENILTAERNAALRAAFAELPPRCQQLLLMLLSDPPHSYTEISAKLGIPVGSIGPQRARCLDRLRRSMASPASLGEAESSTYGEARQVRDE